MLHNLEKAFSGSPQPSTEVPLRARLLAALNDWRVTQAPHLTSEEAIEALLMRALVQEGYDLGQGVPVWQETDAPDLPEPDEGDGALSRHEQARARFLSDLQRG